MQVFKKKKVLLLFPRPIKSQPEAHKKKKEYTEALKL